MNKFRNFIFKSVAVSAALCAAAGVYMPARAVQIPETGVEDHKPHVTAVEDLMREHGLLERVLLAYDEIAARIDANREIPEGAVFEGANIIRSFVENYHEKLEEKYVFPPAGKEPEMKPLIAVLLKQHEAGRALTDRILKDSGAAVDAEKKNLARELRLFVRMYRAHKSREDTVIFTAFRAQMTEKEYRAAGDKFEDEEENMFGQDGFETMVKRVEKLEEKLGIGDLSVYTPAETK